MNRYGFKIEWYEGNTDVSLALPQVLPIIILLLRDCCDRPHARTMTRNRRSLKERASSLASDKFSRATHWVNALSPRSPAGRCIVAEHQP